MKYKRLIIGFFFGVFSITSCSTPAPTPEDELKPNSEEEGEIITKIIQKDSLFYSFTTADSLLCEELHITYNANGYLIEKGCQGTYIGTGMSVGTWYYYENQELIKEITFHNDVQGKDYIIYRYFEGGSLKTERITNNFILYESDSLVLTPAEYEDRKKK